MKKESSPASEGNGVSGVIGGNQAAAEERTAPASATTAASRRGSGSSGGGARPETAVGGGVRGERRGDDRKHGRARRMRENERGGSGECFYGRGRGGRGREPSRFGRRRGEEREREGWDSKSNPSLSSARTGREMWGRWAATRARSGARRGTEKAGGVGRWGAGGWGSAPTG
uniref:Uncharacterized protein n=1 Tax=Oryza sativa subsp. japonica TaxID=39947 RepID=Q6K2F6_ORYSJ|nr:hypothetical protein [Oryza sativa Japonica Group]